MSKKIYILTVFIVFIVGFITGKQDNDKINSIMEKNTIKTNTQIVSQVQNAQESKKDSTTVKQISRKELYYSPKGKIKKVVVIGENINNQEVNTIFATVNKDTFKVVDSNIYYQKEINYKNNWMIQTTYPILEYPDFSKLNLGIGYRIIGDIYMTASTDIKFTQTAIGLILLF
jgi:hypothetical protein